MVLCSLELISLTYIWMRLISRRTCLVFVDTMWLTKFLYSNFEKLCTNGFIFKTVPCLLLFLRCLCWPICWPSLPVLWLPLVVYASTPVIIIICACSESPALGLGAYSCLLASRYACTGGPFSNMGRPKSCQLYTYNFYVANGVQLTLVMNH